MIKQLIIIAIAFSMASTSFAQQNRYTKTDNWQGFQRFYFNINNHEAYFVKPKNPLPGNPWIWRASFPDWHTAMDSILLTKGFYVAFVNVDDQYGSHASMQVWDDAYNYYTDSVGLAKSVALEAVSRGGLYAFGWAKRNPEKVTCIYSETPVLDIKSWPGGKMKGRGDSASWKQLQQVFNVTEAQAMAYKDNPIDNLEGLASYHVPLLFVIGLNDVITPPAENTYILAQRYVALGGEANIHPVTQGPQELYGHHVPIDRPDYYAQFVINNSYPVKLKLPCSKYFELRGGLGNFNKALTEKETITVAFLGGSITYNTGWRNKTSQYLQEHFPQKNFHFIAAGIPSLGSLPHAFRLQQDVLDSGKIDLLFIEAAVNDRANGTDSITQVHALEGILRHAKQINPAMDIIMMSFADPDKTNDYTKGIIPTEILNHELVATHYNLPSINLAKEVVDKMQKGEFSWADDFKDLHPSPFGQELYFASIKALIQNSFLVANKTAKPTVLPKVLSSGSFANGKYYALANARYDSLWALDKDWTPSDGLDTREGFVHVPMLVATKPGATLSLPFTGTAIGLSIISGLDAGIIEYSVDGAPFKSRDLFTQWSTSLHLPWYIILASDLKKGKHTLTIKTSNNTNTNSKGNACRIVHFLVNE